MSASTVRLTAAAAVVEFLKQQFVSRDGVEHRFVPWIAGIFGHGNVAGLGQAIVEHGGPELPFLQPKNEQGMVHTAIAFAKAMRRLATWACTTSIGPGATNLVTGAATATINRLPVLLLPGDTFASRIPDPVLQQLEHPLHGEASVNDCLRPVTRYWDRITRPEQLLRALPEALRVLTSPAETGAVAICLPQDVQAEAFAFPKAFFAKRVHHVPRPPCEPGMLAEAARLLRAANEPLLIAGGGVVYSDAGAALLRFAVGTGIPVCTTQAGKGALDEHHPLSVGAIGVTGTSAANALAERADLVLLVGTRLSDFTTASRTVFKNERVRFVSIQIDARDAVKQGAWPLVGDARVVLEALAEALAGYRVSVSHARAVEELRAAWEVARADILRPILPAPSAPSVAAGENARAEPLTQADVIRVLNETLGRDATIVHAAGGLPGDLHKLWRCASSDEYHAEYGYSCMGYEIAGALGVKLACPDRDVYALVGDGSYLMLHGELVTALQEGRRLTVVLVDNGGYQCIRALQERCGGEAFGNEFRRRPEGGRSPSGETLAIDYVANARSLGLSALRAETEAALRAALSAARAGDRSLLVHVPVVPGPAIPGYAFWDVPISEVSEAPAVAEARRRSLAEKAGQRFVY